MSNHIFTWCILSVSWINWWIWCICSVIDLFVKLSIWSSSWIYLDSIKHFCKQKIRLWILTNYFFFCSPVLFFFFPVLIRVSIHIHVFLFQILEWKGQNIHQDLKQIFYPLMTTSIRWSRTFDLIMTLGRNPDKNSFVSEISIFHITVVTSCMIFSRR